MAASLGQLGWDQENNQLALAHDHVYQVALGAGSLSLGFK